MKVKKKLFLSLALVIGISPAFGQGVPVIDPAQISNQIQQWLVEAENFTKTIDKAQENINLNAEQLASMTGVRDIAAFMDQANGILGQVNDLDNWLTKQGDILKHGQDILSGDLKEIFNSYGLTNLCVSKTGSYKKQCEGTIILDVIKQQNNKNNLSVLKARVDKIDDISKRMTRSDNPKETADLANAMSTQMALLQADKLKMDMQAAIEDSQARLIEKQRLDEIELYSNSFGD